jgi:two-component system sensor histidine kinase AlgZ
MHPILARGGRLAIYVGLWGVAGILLSVVLAAQARLPWATSLAVAMPLAVTYGFICLSAWYVSRSVPLTTSGVPHIVITAIAAAAVSSAAWAALARAWGTVVAPDVAAFATPRALDGTDALLFGFGVLLYFLSVAMSYLLATFEQSRAAERRGLEAQVLAREAELRSLRAQIDPHFLFNSLHSISALTAVDAGGARRMCVLLGDFLRDNLALGSEARITVERELSLAQRFLEIERVRFGERLHYEISMDGAEGCLVPPLLLQPVVENAVTHGVAHLIAGGTIHVTAVRTPSRLSLVVENPCDSDRRRRAGAGVGLANVRGRLQALHGSEARLTAGEHEGMWRVEISIPAEE